ncbi:capsid protein [Roseospira visakhapatnamensis]|uniref:Capsid protein n=1 Tax=Roseospira visakhapatnamensis TaxID=390880 RepID=A0A7W6RGZ3_9PROT|nr:capsid protein [Roseospira visakhapatnamensis]MBB4268282.1 hypothetical protein [Roseospira visakhapatnamensis]
MADDQSQYTEDATQTAIAIAYSNPAHTLIADEVMPRRPVSGLKFKWTSYPIEQSYTIPDTRVGRRSQVRTMEIRGEEHDGSCEDFGLAVPLDNDTIREAERSGFDPRGQRTEVATNVVTLDREQRVAGTVFSAGSYANGLAAVLSGTDQFSDYTNSDPYGGLMDMLNACLLRPNTLVFGQTAWTKVRRHPKLVQAIKGQPVTEGVISRQELAELLEVQQVVVGMGRANVNRPGQAVSLSYLWGPHIAGLFIDPTASPESGGMTWGLTAQFGTRVSGTKAVDMGLRGGEYVRVGETVKELIIAKHAGFLLEDVVATN